MIVKILNSGDEVINATEKVVFVKRADGTVDLIPLYAESGYLRIDVDNIIKIGYGDNIVETEGLNCKVITF